MFVTFEGIEGSGKSTQARRVAEALGPHVLLTREPGGTELGREIRSLVLGLRREDVAPAAESLLFFADRAQHVAMVVRPALAAGRTVLCDRYVDSSLAYQGFGRGLPLAALQVVAELATGGLRPDVTVFLDVSVDSGLARVGRRGRHDRLESERRAFHERVRDGYLELMRAEPERWIRVDAEADHETVFARIRAALAERGVGQRA